MWDMRVGRGRDSNKAAWRQVILLVLSALAFSACDGEQAQKLRAKQATSRYELIGGPVAYADVGDYILENDKIRIGILNTDRSWGPGIFGGSLVDADIRRNDARYPAGSGADRFAEMFPFANLLVPAPIASQIKVLHDGSDGTVATVRVEGKGMFLFDAISILRSQKTTISGIGYKGLTTEVNFRTDYTLHPGDSFVTMKTWVILPTDPDPEFVGDDVSCKVGGDDCAAGLVCALPAGSTATFGTCACASMKDCTIACEGEGARAKDLYGCEVCACSQSLPMNYATGSESVFGTILGDSAMNPSKVQKAGIGAGDFVFFGNQNDIFVPGEGYDEEKPIWDAIFAGKDTFTTPLGLDFVSAAGGDVSYAYYTKKRAGDAAQPKVLVPIITSAATAFIAATLGCKWDASDDATCKTSRVYEFERYLAVGHGDIASVTDIVLQHRGTPVGTVKGYVRWRETGAPAHNAQLFVMNDPDPTQKWQDLDKFIAFARTRDPHGTPGIIDVIDADPGVDLTLDGDFQARLPVGNYVLLATDEHKVVTGDLLQIEVKAGKTVVLSPSLPTPAFVRIQATDNGGAALPAKATIVQLGPDGKPLYRDGGRRPYFGQGRLGLGVQSLSFAMDGKFDVPVQAGRYQIVVSHGIEYSIHNESVILSEGQEHIVQAALRHEVDSTGWASGDFHLHAQPSFDSGMPLDTRVKSIAAEGVDYVASTDHDVLSDYLPFVRQFGIEQWLKTVVGSEVTTLEIGHYIGFPLIYKQLDQPSHGSVDWYCKPSDQILDDILARSGFASKADRPTTIIAHPRDGFLGWAYQAGFNAYSLTRVASMLEADNMTLRTVACDHDAMEVFNGKRFDLIHTPTVKEVHLFSRCLERMDRAGYAADGSLDETAARAALAQACPELAGRGGPDLAMCPASEDLYSCRQRYREALALTVGADILIRTPEEQAAWLNEPTSTDVKEADDKLTALSKLCVYDPKQLDKPFEDVVPKANWDRPCGRIDGTLEDYFRFLQHGLVKTIVGGSDSHGFKQEPGLPRNFVRSSSDTPASVDPVEIAKNLRAGKVTTSYGPLLDVRVQGKGPGETLTVQKGAKVPVHIRIQTPSWFGVDRYEVYVGGLLVAHKDLTTKAKDLEDVDDITIDAPEKDSWVVVTTLGYKPDKLMRPVYLDVPFGEMQLSRVAALAFSKIPIINAIFPAPARVPDFFPVFPMAISNAVFLDIDGDGKYTAPLAYPAFCSPRCDPATGLVVGSATSQKCSDIQSNYKCLLPEGRCGVDIPGVCSIYGNKQGSLSHVLGGHVAP